jgi:hypothetical protein
MNEVARDILLGFGELGGWVAGVLVTLEPASGCPCVSRHSCGELGRQRGRIQWINMDF